MKCRVCRGPAVIDLPAHNANFCAEHFVVFCRSQVEKAIHEFRMLEPSDRVLVAVSGGKDSLALWDILLDLTAARAEGRRVSVTSLCIAAEVPATTALRWIKTMTDAGLFLREADPDDGRRIFIALAEGAFDAMARCFEALDE